MPDNGLVVISGGAGFIGSHLCESYLADGFRVLALDNLFTTKGEPTNITHLAAEHPRFRFERIDVGDGSFFGHQAWFKVVNDVVAPPVHAVLHFAGIASPPQYRRFPATTMWVGSTGTQNMIELAIQYEARFIMASTSEVYGDPLEHPQSESYWGNVNPVGPRSCYDESKRFSEAMCRAYADQYGLDYAIARLFNTYGPRMQMDDGRLIPEILRCALTGDTLFIYGDGSQTRSLQYVEDTIHGIRTVEADGINAPVNIGGAVEMTVLDIVALAEDVLDTRIKVAKIADPIGDDPKRRLADTRLLRKLGWNQRVPLHVGLAATYDWLEHGHPSSRS